MISAKRPKLELLNKTFIETIIEEAYYILSRTKRLCSFFPRRECA
jgi:hypothetical protein